MRIVGILQARYNSTRLPGKVCMEINGLPVLWHIYRRLLACEELDQVVVSMGESGRDQISDVCMKYNMYGEIGPEEDLIARHIQTGWKHKADAIVRITSDCLFHNPKYIDDACAIFRREWPKMEALTNWHPSRTISEGLDMDLWSMKALADLDRMDDCPRENFALWAFEHRAIPFAQWETDWQIGSNAHLSIDTQEDFDMAKKMLKILGNDEWRYTETMKAYSRVKAEEGECS